MTPKVSVDCEPLKQLIREVPDFPKPGILFYDITTLLKDKRGFATQTAYDPLNRIVLVRDPLDQTIETTYGDGQNRRIDKDKRRIRKLTQMDPLGRVVRVIRPHDPATGDGIPLETHTYDGDNNRLSTTDAEDRATAAHRDHETAAEEEAAAHRAVADRRAELIAAEAAEQQARQRARAARRTREDTDRTLRDAVRRRGVARDRLAALED